MTGLCRNTLRYKPEPDKDVTLRKRMKELAEQRRKFGSPRLHVLLKREELVVNHKRTERIYREEGLALRKRKRRRKASVTQLKPDLPTRPNQKWSMDFVYDQLVNGRRLRCLTIVDDYTRECVAIEVDTSLKRGESMRFASSGCQPKSFNPRPSLKRGESVCSITA